MTSVRTQALHKDTSSWLLILSSFVLNIGSLRVFFFFWKSLLVPKKKNHFYSNLPKKKFLKMTFSLMTSFEFFGKHVRKTPHLHKQNQLCFPLLSLHVLDYFLFKRKPQKYTHRAFLFSKTFKYCLPIHAPICSSLLWLRENVQTAGVCPVLSERKKVKSLICVWVFATP